MITKRLEVSDGRIDITKMYLAHLDIELPDDQEIQGAITAREVAEAIAEAA